MSTYAGGAANTPHRPEIAHKSEIPTAQACLKHAANQRICEKSPDIKYCGGDDPAMEILRESSFRWAAARSRRGSPYSEQHARNAELLLERRATESIRLRAETTGVFPSPFSMARPAARMYGLSKSAIHAAAMQPRQLQLNGRGRDSSRTLRRASQIASGFWWAEPHAHFAMTEQE